MSIELFILAGGLSSRMGCDKRFLELGGLTMIERTAGSFSRLFERVSIVLGAGGSIDLPGVRQVHDLLPGKGPLGGIYTAMKFSRAEKIFVSASDMPFLDSVLIKRMLIRSGGNYDIIVPEHGCNENERKYGKIEPLHAIYPVSLINNVAARIQENQLSVTGFIRSEPGVLYERVGKDATAFYNINTPDDYLKAKMLLSSKNGC